MVFYLQDGTERRFSEGLSLSLIDAVKPNIVSDKLNHVSNNETEGDILIEGELHVQKT